MFRGFHLTPAVLMAVPTPHNPQALQSPRLAPSSGKIHRSPPTVLCDNTGSDGVSVSFLPEPWPTSAHLSMESSEMAHKTVELGPVRFLAGLFCVALLVANLQVTRWIHARQAAITPTVSV